MDGRGYVLPRDAQVKKLLLIAFMAVTTQCENWGGINSGYSPFDGYRHPRCIENNHIFETKKELASFLKQQDNRSFPRHRAYEIKPMEYELEVVTEQQRRTQEIIEEVETKREIEFK